MLASVPAGLLFTMWVLRYLHLAGKSLLALGRWLWLSPGTKV